MSEGRQFGPDDEIGVKELAEARKMTRRAVRRWLCGIERSHPGIVSRRDGRMVTTPERIRLFMKAPRPVPTKLGSDVRRLRGRVEDLERRADRHALEMAELRRQSSEWFRSRVGQ